MTAHHAIEITLSRPATHCELRRACRAVPLGANTDHTRLLALQRAKTPGRALRTLRNRLDALLPIDVLTTHYPDRQGCVLLNVAFSRAVHTAVRQAAAARGQRPRDFLRKTVTADVVQHHEERARHLTNQLEGLLAQYNPEDLLLCAANTLLKHSRRPSGEPSSTPS
ncbi:hypothetical protein ACF07B_34110 [Streptomyces sp. NPDC015532]|uniref:hypothetical protein n=1 Tax=Streptomyces sp. NPDC015532 TaxID=3364960 RepID=UPI0036FAD095